MRKIRRAMFYVLGTAGLLFVLAGCAWIYATSTVEHAPYSVLIADGDIEKRAYPALIAAEVQTAGSRSDAVRAGFSPLARYIFARERPGDQIAMTAPVTQRPDDEDRWTIAFIMPATYRMHELPEPAQGSVSLKPLPPSENAAIRFSGVATDETIAQHEARLRTWMEAQGYEPGGAPVYAYYNDPWTPGFLRRNEVIIPILSPG
ncbi:MAG: heme-binding protein [Pseudomonadota bacterium]